MRWSLLLCVALAVSGCLTVAQTSYEAATDERSVETQKDDARIDLTITKRLLESSVKGTGSLDVFCRNGVVVLAGVVESDSQAGAEALRIARQVEGVKRVESYFLRSQPSKLDDFTIKQKIGVKLIGDGDLNAGQVDMAVIAGHVVLVGVVDQQAKLDKIVAHARSTDGVVLVKSFIQVTGR